MCIIYTPASIFDLLVENLAGDDVLAAKAMDSLVRALATATPGGKQNSFAHHPLAHYIRAERGGRQPRDLSGAFFAPVDLRADDLVRASIKRLEQMAERIDRAYGAMADQICVMNLLDGEGSLDDLAAFAAQIAERPFVSEHV